MEENLKIKGKKIKIHKANNFPQYSEKSVLTDSTWNYVDMWLKRNSYKEALFFWEQAKYFYNASKLLPILSSPLTSYYCFLNATKALLLVKNIHFNDSHGVTGYSKKGQIALINEKIKSKSSGILPALSKCLNINIINEKEYNMKDLMYNLSFIHRAFIHTFRTAKDLFIPVKNISFIKK